MRKILNQQFVQNKDNLYILHGEFVFWDFFKILKRHGYEPEDALNFIFTNCSLSAVVFQECIINNKYIKLS
jgi:hypothetical protein